jgi:tryptophanyl-tRNA synthetase
VLVDCLTLWLGNLMGALDNWVGLQDSYECFFPIVDWHSLTTDYSDTSAIRQNILEVATDWLAAGLDPVRSVLFIQSLVPEHAELHLLLSMITPLSWLERVPTYKDQQQKLADRDLANFGFLGYPVMQGADILIYRANMVPVGEDQVPHIELVRELARRFNFIYGREAGFEDKAKAAVKKLGAKKARRYGELRTAFQERGDDAALESAKELLNETQNLSLGDRERLFGYVEGGGKMILTEPQSLLTEASKMPGIDGLKLLEHIKSSLPLTPVMLMSGFSSVEVKEMRSRGATDFIPKPIRLDDLENKIQERTAQLGLEIEERQRVLEPTPGAEEHRLVDVPDARSETRRPQESQLEAPDRVTPQDDAMRGPGPQGRDQRGAEPADEVRLQDADGDLGHQHDDVGGGQRQEGRRDGAFEQPASPRVHGYRFRPDYELYSD